MCRRTEIRSRLIPLVEFYSVIDIRDNDTLEAVGLDSVEISQLECDIEEEFTLLACSVDLESNNTIETVIDIVKEQIKKQEE